MKESKIFHFFKAFDMLDKILIRISQFAAFSMMALVTVDVIARRFLMRPIVGAVEITQDYLMIGLIFCALSYVYTSGGHVRVTLFAKYIPKSLKRPIDVILTLISLTFFVIMAWKGLETTVSTFQMKEVSNSLIAYPMYPAYFMVFLGALLISIRIIQDIFHPPAEKDEILD